jgi:predicted nucleotidyltransferase
MATPNIGAMRTVAGRLDELRIPYAFVGGSIVNLLLDYLELSPARPTDDVDVILEVATSGKYAEIEARLRKIGFDHNIRQGAPIYRWVLGNLTVDIMPTKGDFIGLNTTWFEEALLNTAVDIEIAHTRLRVISPIAFLATKCVAFVDRGNSNFYASADIEDFVAVKDGREKIVSELRQAPESMRRYLVNAVKSLVSAPDFGEALHGHLPSDTASQQRLPLLRQKLAHIAALK